jgi:prepilin-type processing-associated H-X9-DG protein
LSSVKRTSEFGLKGGADRIFTFVDTHADSIQTGLFRIHPGTTKVPISYWHELPSIRHGRSASIAFADGHVVSRKWTDSRLFIPEIRYAPGVLAGFLEGTGSVDREWMLDNCGVRP